MKASLPGLLSRAAEVCETSPDVHGESYGFGLRELLENLRELRADEHKLQEFFTIYTDEG